MRGPFPFAAGALLCLAACTTIDLAGLSRGDGGGAATVSSGATAPSSVSSGSGGLATSASSTGTTTGPGATSTVGSAATGCPAPFCTGVTKTACWDFDDGAIPAGFELSDFNGVGMLDVAPSPGDACSWSLRAALTGFDVVGDPAYWRHGRRIDVSGLTSSLSFGFRAYTATAAPTSVGVLGWKISGATCEIVMFLEAQNARMFMQTMPDGGDWTFVGGVDVPIASPTGRWVDWSTKLALGVGGIEATLTADGGSQSAPPTLTCASVPVDGQVTLWLGATYVTTPQTIYFDDVVLDLL